MWYDISLRFDDFFELMYDLIIDTFSIQNGYIISKYVLLLDMFVCIIKYNKCS